MLSLQQTAAALGVTPSKVFDLIQSGTLPILDFESHGDLVRLEFAPAVVNAVAVILRDKAT